MAANIGESEHPQIGGSFEEDSFELGGTEGNQSMVRPNENEGLEMQDVSNSQPV